MAENNTEVPIWRFYARLISGVSLSLGKTIDNVLATIGVVAFLILLFNKPFAEKILSGEWGGVSQWWAAAPVGLLFLYSLLRSNYETFQKVIGELAEHRARIAEYEGAVPKITLDEQVNATIYWDTDGSEPRYDLLHLARLRFRNHPQVRDERARAKQVVAHVDYYDSTGRTKLFQRAVYGRWSNAPPARDLKISEQADHLLPVDFGLNQISQDLDVVVKYEQDDDCYVWDNELARNGNLRRWSAYRITDRVFRVRVELVGDNVDLRYWWVVVRNLGKGQGFQVDKAPNPTTESATDTAGPPNQ